MDGPKDYLQSFPMESQKLLNEGAKGDFTSLVSREEDSHLGKQKLIR